jgi:hypothetical protein
MGRLAVVVWVLLALWGCSPQVQPDRELHEALKSARQQAQLERERVLALELRLARLEEQSAALARKAGHPELVSRADVQERSTGETERLLDKLDLLIGLNRDLARRVEAAPAMAASIPERRVQGEELVLTDAEGASGGEDALATEEQIRMLVRQLRQGRSPWRADGLSYEESQALRLLLRRDRPLDTRNPWH